MKKVICVLILFLAGCSSDEADNVIMKSGKHDLGKGFYTIDVQTKLPEGSPQKYHLSKDLCYKNKKIDEALYAFVSPTGRFALYESMITGGIVLFDAKKNQKYHVIEGGLPSVEQWSKDEKIFALSYYPPSSAKRTIRIHIDNLKLLEK